MKNFILILAMLFSLFSFGTIRYVSPDGAGDKNGTSWENAFDNTQLQLAINNSVSGDEVWVAAGTYKPTQGTDRTISFNMKEGVAIYGGFAGNEVQWVFDLSLRDFGLNETILSGDIGTPQDTSDNSYHVFFHNETHALTNAAILDGFTITEGVATSQDYPHYFGGGMVNNYCSPTLRNINFISNAAKFWGGAMTNFCSSPIITDTKFDSNTAFRGGAINNSGNASNISSPVFTNVSFTDNIATGGDGGVFTNNNHSEVTITNGLFYNNKAIFNIPYSQGGNGGAIHNAYLSTLVLTNCTFSKNDAERRGGAIYSDNSDHVINNSIIWGNTATNGKQFFLSGSTIAMNYSCFMNGTDDIDGGSLTVDAYSITTNPYFTDAQKGNLSLFSNSPCINKGNNSYNTTTVDIRGETRIQNSTIDIGAYEFTSGVDPESPIFYVDATSSGTNDGSSWANAFLDLQTALENASVGHSIWVAAGTYYPSADNGMGDGSDPSLYHFRMKEGVQIYGGFAGNEDRNTFNLNDRNFATNETVLSGDIGIKGDNSDNCYTIIYNSGDYYLDNEAVLDGFTITLANNPRSGAGMYNSSSSPTLKNVIFQLNSAQGNGGGMYNYMSNPILEYVTFIENSATMGAGLYNDYSSPIMNHITLNTNIAVVNGGGMYNYYSNPEINVISINNNEAINGGGVYNFNSYPKFKNATFNSNTATESGGGMYCEYSNMMPSPTTDDLKSKKNEDNLQSGKLSDSGLNEILIENSVFEKNVARGGGAILNYESTLRTSKVDFISNSASDGSGGAILNLGADLDIIRSTFLNNNSLAGGAIANYSMGNNSFSLGITNSLFANNTAVYSEIEDYGGIGGAISNWGLDVFIINSSFYGNNAETSSETEGGMGGCIYNSNSNIEIQNSIIWGNTASKSIGNQLYFEDTYAVLNNTNFANEQGDVFFNDPDNYFFDTDQYCINEDPKFVDVTTADFRISKNSPCLNSGENSYCTETYDLRGQDRIQDGIIDMGAYEWTAGLDPAIATLTTNDITDITLTTTTSGGNISSDGGDAVTARGVCWSTSALPTIADSYTVDGDGTGEFISSITGLARNTTYYVRAYATNSTGTYYGEQISFATKPFENGAGIDGNPYEIATLEDLRFLSENSTFWNKWYIQTADIDATETSGWNSGAGWSPIGTFDNAFSGNYNGQGHVIDALYINQPSTFNIGFIGVAGGATIDSLGLTNCSIVGDEYVGSLVGRNWQANINNCFSTGTVSGRNQIGGFSGQTNNSVINNCYTTVNISAEHTYGGFTGWNNGTTTNCYSSGQVSGPPADGYKGGFTGYNTGTITNSFYDLNTSGQNDNIGRGVPKTSAEMKILSTFTDADWDFKGETTNGTSEIWNMGNERNNGYPYLNWQYPSDPVAIILTTSEIVGITVSSANSGGDITSDGGDAVTARGVCWSTSALPTIADSLTVDGDGTGEFISSITGLARNTTYYVRAYATNANGTFYGEQDSFTTSAINVTVYVDASKVDDSGDGLSWKTAKKSLQSALSYSIDGDEIWVAKGTYYPEIEIGGTGDRYKTFQLKEGVSIYGGFAGFENTVAERTDFGLGNTNETILSGDIGTQGDNTDNCYHVFYHPDGMVLTAAAVIDGFTITGGNANAANPHSDGGGMCTYSSPTIKNVTFFSNSGSFGGGLYTRNSTSIISNALFVSNTASQYGGGMFNDSSSPVLSNATFSKNIAVSFGGGIASVYSTPVLNNCIIWGNESSSGNELFIFDGTTTLNYSCYSNGNNDVYGTNFIASNHNITSDPKFADATGNDFRLLGNSPCVNSGENSYNSTARDIRGQERIQNTTIDMGAYEWTSGEDPNGIDNELILGTQDFPGGTNLCLNAIENILVAGGGAVVNIEHDATVEFIAGKSIRFLPGFHAESGSSVYAHITSDGSFCDGGSASPVVVQPIDKSQVEEPEVEQITPDSKSIKVFPNPNSGRFNIVLTNMGENAMVMVYNMLGSRVYQSSGKIQNELEINLPALQKGIYIVKVVDINDQFTKKMIVN
jgi:predicted outer membrane repeat protein